MLELGPWVGTAYAANAFTEEREETGRAILPSERSDRPGTGAVAVDSTIAIGAVEKPGTRP
jgi:hypothetical protein